MRQRGWRLCHVETGGQKRAWVEKRYFLDDIGRLTPHNGENSNRCNNIGIPLSAKRERGKKDYTSEEDPSKVRRGGNRAKGGERGIVDASVRNVSGDY